MTRSRTPAALHTIDPVEKTMDDVSQNLLKRLTNSVTVPPMLSHHRCSTEVA
ncbi:hypothetical protein C7S14_5236 [Burkholderia cepacia]|nr:hypothetical protein C7S14_5236 [Burkholderia cepacia]